MTLEEMQLYLREEAAAGQGCLIQLTRGLVTSVDEADFDEVNSHNWYAQKSRCRFYAARRVGSRILLLHRELLQAPQGLFVDHENWSTLDCRRKNIRIATPQQNAANSQKRPGTTSQYKGVCRVKPRVNNTNVWMAYIGGAISSGSRLKRIHLGYFSTEVDAAIASDSAAKKHFGNFAALNFP